MCIFFFKHKTAYELRIRDWSSDVCSSDLHGPTRVAGSVGCDEKTIRNARDEKSTLRLDFASNLLALDGRALDPILNHYGRRSVPVDATCDTDALPAMTGAVHKLVSSIARSEEHTSALQSLMRNSYA